MKYQEILYKIQGVIFLGDGMAKKRCVWCNEKNEKYVCYHDKEWGVLNLSDSYLFEMLLLEAFQAGLSWECVLNKREAFRKAFDNFDYVKISKYSSERLAKIQKTDGIIKHRGKIEAAVTNAEVFLLLIEEFGCFEKYLRNFWNGKVIYETDLAYSPLSEKISKDLQKRGMKFMGKTIVYSFLQAIGIVYSHEKGCFLFKNGI